MKDHNMLLQAATDYVAFGLRVIALSGKMPNVLVHRHGVKDAIGVHEGPAATERLARAFGHSATTGVGIATSYPLVVVDIDGEEGARAWLDLAGDDWAQGAWVASTGRGMHLYMLSEHPTGSLKLAPLLDLKGEGGYVAAPPSLHPSGARYEWLAPPADALPEVPDALRRRIMDTPFERERGRVTKSIERKVRHQPFEGFLLWASLSFDGMFDGLRAQGEGNRNNYLHWAANVMADEGATDEEFAMLAEAALVAGLLPSETASTIRSARSDSRHDRRTDE